MRSAAVSLTTFVAFSVTYFGAATFETVLYFVVHTSRLQHFAKESRSLMDTVSSPIITEHIENSAGVVGVTNSRRPKPLNIVTNTRRPKPLNVQCLAVKHTSEEFTPKQREHKIP